MGKNDVSLRRRRLSHARISYLLEYENLLEKEEWNYCVSIYVLCIQMECSLYVEEMRYEILYVIIFLCPELLYYYFCALKYMSLYGDLIVWAEQIVYQSSTDDILYKFVLQSSIRNMKGKEIFTSIYHHVIYVGTYVLCAVHISNYTFIITVQSG